MNIQVLQLIVAVVAGIATPVAVWYLGHRFQSGLSASQQQFQAKLSELQQDHERRLATTEWRRQSLDRLRPLLNDLYCYYLWVGTWKELSPSDIIARKRELDREFLSQQILFSNQLYTAYQRFMNACFVPQAGGPGGDALMLTTIVSKDGDRKEVLQRIAPGRWLDDDDARFRYDCEPGWPKPEACQASAPADVRFPVCEAYNLLLLSIADELGLETGTDSARPPSRCDHLRAPQGG
jgi:hypothetical protein